MSICHLGREGETTSLTVADGSQCVVVLYALAYDPPLGEEGVAAEGIHVKAAPGSH